MEPGRIATFLSFLPKKIPAEHLHISDTSDSNVGFWVLDRFFSVTTLNYRYIGARAARGKTFDRYGLGNLGFGFRSSCGGWVLGFGAPARAGFWVSGSGPETRARGQTEPRGLASETCKC